MRPRKCRFIRFRHNAYFFKPQGIPLRFLDIIEISADEAEAIRLKNIKNLEQKDAAKKMKISQSTFQRTLQSAYRKISRAIIEGKAIKIILD
jgi:predicted DNA-binding protein (UPF0251 family)